MKPRTKNKILVVSCPGVALCLETRNINLHHAFNHYPCARDRKGAKTIYTRRLYHGERLR